MPKYQHLRATGLRMQRAEQSQWPISGQQRSRGWRPSPRTQGRSCSRMAAGEASAPNRCSLLMAREKNMINPFDASSHRPFPFRSQCLGWTSPCGSYDDCKMYLSNSHPGTLRKHGPLEDTWASSVLPSPLDPPKGPHLCLGTEPASDCPAIQRARYHELGN